MSIERYLIEHCSPTLASLKTGNLFGFDYDCESDLIAHVKEWNEQLNYKGVFVEALKVQNNRALIYVYRKDKLAADLKKEGVAGFLKKYGYEDITIDVAINILNNHLYEQEGFPHEIGLFLDYPLGDVIGFIENRGKNPKCTGCWKVYCDVCEAQKLFYCFKKCTAEFINLWNQGKTVWQLTVAA